MIYHLLKKEQYTDATNSSTRNRDISYIVSVCVRLLAQ